MTASHILDPAGLLSEALTEASPDLMRYLLQTMINALLSADQDFVFGHGGLHNAFSLVDLLENGGPGGGSGYDDPRRFDYKPSRTEDESGVWESAKANVRTYLLLKERAAVFRADPEVQQALAADRAAELSEPTLGADETVEALLADRSAFEDFDASAYFKGKDFGYVRRRQLATEQLLGAH